MLKEIFALVLIFIWQINGADPIPKWAGQFNLYTADRHCNPNRCCCLSGYMTITTPSSITVRLQGQLQGQSCPDESYDLTVDYSQPVGQFLLVTKLNVTLRMDTNNNQIDITPYGGGGGECLHRFLRKGTVV